MDNAAEAQDLELDSFAPALEQAPRQLEVAEIRTYPSNWILSWSNVRRYQEAPDDTMVPLEFAFYLLGDVTAKTIVDLGCGDGLNTAILAMFGAKVIAIDASQNNLALTAARIQANGVAGNVTLLRASGVRIPVADASADRVFCTTAFDQSDFLGIARQIRRVLKPGGTATFLQARTVSRDQMEKISRAVGSPGRQREFTFVARMLSRLGVQRNLNMWMPRRFTSFVWEARKEA